MTKDLKRMLAETAHKERLEREIQIARQIQLNLLPSNLPTVKGYDFSASSNPSEDVGGDYYDIFVLEDGRVAFALGDVSGKGVPAALLMSNLQAALQVQITENIALEEVAKKLNRLIHKNSTSEMFITCFLGILTPKTGSFSYVNAGHDVPVLLNDKNDYTLDTGGLMFGALPEADYRSETIQLSEGDVLVLYSDGLTEAMDENETEFGRKRILNSIQDCRDKKASEILERIKSDVLEFSGTERSTMDDQTLLVLKVSDIPEDQQEMK